jgi:hypothetical protein
MGLILSPRGLNGEEVIPIGYNGDGDGSRPPSPFPRVPVCYSPSLLRAHFCFDGELAHHGPRQEAHIKAANPNHPGLSAPFSGPLAGRSPPPIGSSAPLPQSSATCSSIPIHRPHMRDEKRSTIAPNLATDVRDTHAAENP